MSTERFIQEPKDALHVEPTAAEKKAFNVARANINIGATQLFRILLRGVGLYLDPRPERGRDEALTLAFHKYVQEGYLVKNAEALLETLKLHFSSREQLDAIEEIYQETLKWIREEKVRLKG
jgi:hypothetical protein